MSTLTHCLRSQRHYAIEAISSGAAACGRAYDHVGDQYRVYADGVESASGEQTKHAHADALLWSTICTAIDDLKAEGRSFVRVLDAGCGPGSWTIRASIYACQRGLSVEATGCDLSRAQLLIAQASLDASYSTLPAQAKIRFVTQDLAQALPWPDAHFDLVLCNFAVLNHLRSNELPSAVSELCRVARREVMATFRAVASPPTACIIGLENVASYHLDEQAEELSLVLKDGSRHVLPFRLYSSREIKAVFERTSIVKDLRAVNLFSTRFAVDDNWTSGLLERSCEHRAVLAELDGMEEALCRSPGWIDHGTHVLVVAERRESN